MNKPTAMPDTMKAQKAPITPLTSGTTQLPMTMLTAQTAVVGRNPPHKSDTTPTTEPPGTANPKGPVTLPLPHGVDALPAAIV